MISHLYTRLIFVTMLVLLCNTGMWAQSGSSIVLENSLVRILITEDGKLSSCVDKTSGTDIAAHDNTPFAKIKTQNGLVFPAQHLELIDDILVVSFGCGSVSFKVKTYNEYFVFILNSSLPSNGEELSFANMKFAYDYSRNDAFVASAVALSINTNSCYYPSGASKEVVGKCYSSIGCNDVMLAVTICNKCHLRNILKSIYDAADCKSILQSKAGGAYAMDYPMICDEFTVYDSDPSKLNSWVDFCSSYGIGMLEFGMGNRTFIQGDFSFPLLGSASQFKNKISEPLSHIGISTALHTYSYYIGYDSVELLSNPIWQQQLEFRDSFSLASSVQSDSDIFYLRGQLQNLVDNSSYWKFHTPYALIEQEIVKYSIGPDGSISCLRGQCGTKATSHKSGSAIRMIGGYYGQIAPQPGSDLFYEIARRTAKAYNDGGFRAIYFDAFDSLHLHLSYASMAGFQWYYGASFINEVIKNCDVPPLVEYSIFYPSIWSARTRSGAWDRPVRCYKNVVDKHMASNLETQESFLPTTMGWYSFHPSDNQYPWNFSTKFMHFDDVDYLGVVSVAYDQSMVFNSTNFAQDPLTKRNLKIFHEYSQLRQKHYFSDRIIKKLQMRKFEYKLYEKNGKWRFKEAIYCKSKLHDISISSLNGFNPFAKQRPFIRVENLYTSHDLDGRELMSFDPSMGINKQNLRISYSDPIDLSDKMAIKVRVKGAGKNSNDAMCIRLYSTKTDAYSVTDYILKLDFDEWRDIILASQDYGDYPELSFAGLEDNFALSYKRYLDYHNVTGIGVYLAGDCSEVRLSKISAVSLESNIMTTPSVIINGHKCTFKGDLNSGECLEWNPNNVNAKIFDKYGNERFVDIDISKGFDISHGAYNASLSCESPISSGPFEAILTIGLYGRYI